MYTSRPHAPTESARPPSPPTWPTRVFPLDVATIADRTADTAAGAAARGIDLRLHPGGEIFPHFAIDLSRDELELIAQGPRARAGCCSRCRSTASTRRSSRPGDTCAATGSASWSPTPSAPPACSTRGSPAAGAIEDGALLQVNVCSLLGRHGAEARVGRPTAGPRRPRLRARLRRARRRPPGHARCGRQRAPHRRQSALPAPPRDPGGRCPVTRLALAVRAPHARRDPGVAPARAVVKNRRYFLLVWGGGG